MPTFEEIKKFKNPGLNLPKGIQHIHSIRNANNSSNTSNNKKKQANLSVNNLQLNLPKKNTSNSVANMMKPKRQMKTKATMKIKM